jgi:hypothetical protein
MSAISSMPGRSQVRARQVPIPSPYPIVHGEGHIALAPVYAVTGQSSSKEMFMSATNDQKSRRGPSLIGASSTSRTNVKPQNHCRISNQQAKEQQYEDVPIPRAYVTVRSEDANSPPPFVYKKGSNPARNLHAETKTHSPQPESSRPQPEHPVAELSGKSRPRPTPLPAELPGESRPFGVRHLRPRNPPAPSVADSGYETMSNSTFPSSECSRYTKPAPNH